MRKGFIVLGFLALMLPASAWAQCTSGLISNCPSAVNPQANDIQLGWQFGQSPHTRGSTNAQILTGALQSPVTGKITAQVSSAAQAGLNLQIGAGPSQCAPGDVWITQAGLFSCRFDGVPTGPYTTGNAAGSLPVFSIATLPAVNVSNRGNEAFVTDCVNGTQSGGTIGGCLYIVSSLGAWVAQPNPSNLSMTIGGQTIFLGQATVNQGNGSKIALASGSFVNGNCRQSDASGNEIDAGGPCSAGGGGSGTVTSSLQNSVPVYSTGPSGTTIAGQTIVNNAVEQTNGSGVPSFSTTLPSGLTIPAPTMSGPTITGTATVAAANFSGLVKTAASVSGSAGINITPGVTPSNPNNGDVWDTTAGLFSRISGANQGPYLWTVNATSPLGGGGAGPTLTLTCTTCATTTSGGALTATAPMTISSGGLIALGTVPSFATWIDNASTTVTNDTYDLIENWTPTLGGTVDSVTYLTGGTGSPNFKLAVQVNGVNAGSCTNLTVSSSTKTTTSCGGAVISNGQKLSIIISSVAGTPFSSVIQVNYHKPAS